jgi:hypothetical protein
MPDGDTACRKGIPVERIGFSAFTLPTDGPEADGTFAWDSTTLVLVEASAGGRPSTAAAASPRTRSTGFLPRAASGGRWRP